MIASYYFLIKQAGPGTRSEIVRREKPGSGMAFAIK
jgi:hypothetical protein